MRIGDYAGMRGTTLAVQLSNMMRILPQSVLERTLLISGSLLLSPEYPEIVLGALDGTCWIDANYIRAIMKFQCSVVSFYRGIILIAAAFGIGSASLRDVFF